MRTIEALAPRRKELRLNLAVNQTIVDAGGRRAIPRAARAARAARASRTKSSSPTRRARRTRERTKRTSRRAIPASSRPFGTFYAPRSSRGSSMRSKPTSPPIRPPNARRSATTSTASATGCSAGGASPNPRCVALHAHLRMFPNGDVPVCQFNTAASGICAKQTFDEVWFGEARGGGRDVGARLPRLLGRMRSACRAPFYSGDILRHTLATPVSLATSKERPRMSTANGSPTRPRHRLRRIHRLARRRALARRGLSRSTASTRSTTTTIRASKSRTSRRRCGTSASSSK